MITLCTAFSVSAEDSVSPPVSGELHEEILTEEIPLGTASAEKVDNTNKNSDNIGDNNDGKPGQNDVSRDIGEAENTSASTNTEMTILDLYIFGNGVCLPEYPLLENGTVLLPIKVFLENLGSFEFNFDGQSRITIASGERNIDMDIGSVTAYQNGEAISLGTPPILVGNTVYAPMRFICEYFGYSVTAEKSSNHLIVNVDIPAPSPADYVNSAGLSSQTPYLIWVNKSDYTVYVFLGSKNNWEQIYSCKCAIGAPQTPTITGTYKFYSLEKRWNYEDFYVGPIMRFYGGYAIHSTLLKYDGSNYNATVGKKLSHGCVRVRPDDIAWLVYYVPLQTTIHITEN